MRRLLLSCGLTLLPLLPAVAQRGRSSMGPESFILAGPSPYDLAESGTGFSARTGLGFRPTRRVLILEPGLGLFVYRNAFQVRTTWWLPELSLQAELARGRLRPFVGGGGGAGVESLPGSDRWRGALHAVGGVRFQLARTWGLRGEVRFRGIHHSGHMTDFTVGAFTGVR